MRRVLYILGSLADEDLDWMINAGVKQVVPQGTALVTEGQPLDAIFIVIDGKLTVSTGQSGARRKLAELGRGEIVGEISLLDSRPPSATVTAEIDSRVLKITRSKLQAKLDSDHRFGSRFYRSLAVFLAQRLRQTVASMGFGDVKPSEDDLDAADEIDPELMENLSLAGARFNWLFERLQD